jgi:hypothetical protein
VFRVVTLAGEIVISKIALIIDSAGEIVAAEIVIEAFVGILAKESSARAFAYRLFWRSITLAASAPGLAESSSRRGIGSEASAAGALGAGRLGELATWRVRSRRRSLRPVFALASLVDRKRSPHENLIIERANCRLCLRPVAELDERKATRLTCLAIEREVDVRKRADGRKVLAQRSLSRAVRKIPNKKPNSHPIPSIP